MLKNGNKNPINLTNLAKKCIHNLIFGRIYSIIEDGRVKKTDKKKESESIF